MTSPQIAPAHVSYAVKPANLAFWHRQGHWQLTCTDTVASLVASLTAAGYTNLDIRTHDADAVDSLGMRGVIGSVNLAATDPAQVIVCFECSRQFETNAPLPTCPYCLSTDVDYAVQS